MCNVDFATNSRQGTLYVRHFLTHAEYDRDDWKNICC
ncbi:MAG: type II toxin-antitoxin system HigB family toxin [Planctomycetota bacterium]|nr:type II toxin-antitoxin system HigB family toxin [Planctomycetota bacterium]